VHTVLTDLGLGETVENGLVEVLNKVDLLTPERRAVLHNQAQRNRDVVPLSAKTGEGCPELLVVFDRRLDGDRRLVQLDVPLADGAALAWLYAHGEVLGRRDDDERAHLEVRLSEADLGRFRQRRHG
jgi:GTP-binding protein HflX